MGGNTIEEGRMTLSEAVSKARANPSVRGIVSPFGSRDEERVVRILRVGTPDIAKGHPSTMTQDVNWETALLK